MLKVYRAKNVDQTNVAELFDQYRVFYKMSSDINAASKFVNDRINLNDSLIYIVKYSGNACGFIQIYPAFSSVAMKPIWILNDLFVNQDFRKKGCAKALMEKVKTDAIKKNIFSIKLATATDNSKAKKLYESLNYQKIATFDNYSLKI